MPSSTHRKSKSGSQNDAELLDVLNRQLLAILAEDARISVSALARRVGMSAPAVRERILRLERAGVIRGYRIDIDPAAVGLPVSAWVRVRPGPGQLRKVVELAEQTPQVTECYRITGEDCLLCKVHGPSVEELESVLDGFLMFGQTTTSMIVATPVPTRAPAAP